MSIADDVVVWSGHVPSYDSSTVSSHRFAASLELPESIVLRDATTNTWLIPTIRDMLTKAVRDRIDSGSLARCIGWLGRLPIGIPKPFFATGDDASLGLEWERHGNYLYVVFGRTSDQVYFEGSNGDEWESDLFSATDKLNHAMRMIATS
jgi:hypothetical protein